jgi:hypothetical protein
MNILENSGVEPFVIDYVTSKSIKSSLLTVCRDNEALDSQVVWFLTLMLITNTNNRIC